ncbi:hypothetical protein SAMN02745157_2813 [Kaistia soli DSM 19436]|uniref:Uncharacterized protein n=1 Tax=Kaistia soli DSM 19436 TaxID=1122133 RepID=A0A1M5DW01_9HYPH|nr:hypothetical protein [Kaistia soli]SHF71110.1 hypothetical protein SAMN02745157_2813 [Kaistia soli DSM 19436]
MRAFLRIILLIPLGLIAAILTAVAVYLLAFGFKPDDFQFAPDGLPPGALAPAFVLTGVLAQGALLPFLVAIAVAEVFTIRSLIAWVLFGGALGFALQLVGLPGNMAFLPPVAAGFAAGFAYWLVAGRGAGLRERVTFRAPE